MPLNLSAAELTELKPRISVIGVGGAGGNAVNNMIAAKLDGVEFVVANTDAQAVNLSGAPHKIQLGTNVTQGLGAGSMPEIGKAAAEESIEEVMNLIEGSNMVFITAGMGGGTGTGAAPVIAKAARDRGILTVGVVTKPFQFEGQRRMRIADQGIEALQEYVDTLLIIPNQNLFRLADENTTFQGAFAMADQVLHQGVRGITDLMIVPGHINLDFADVRTVMSEMGKAMMGTGEASGDDRANAAAVAAISNPLLDESSMKGAKGVLINITGGLDMKLFEVDEAANRIRSEVDPDANIIVGSTFNQELEGVIRVSVVATGIERAEGKVAAPIQITQPVTKAPVVETVVEETVDLADVGPEIEEELEFDMIETPEEPEVPSPSQPPITHVMPQHQPNPVGDVHDRIRRMLTEDNAVPLRETVQPEAQRANPFREALQGSPFEGVMGRLKNTFAGKVGTQSQPAQPTRRALADDDPEDLEIPAFLRRNSGQK